MRVSAIQFLSGLAMMASWTYVQPWAAANGVSKAGIAWAFMGYAGAVLASALVMGRLADRYGKKGFVVAGLAWVLVFYAAHALATSVWTLVASRTLLGLGMGTFPPALAAYAYGRDRRMGRFASFFSLGWAAGGLLGGAAASYDLRAVFLLSAAASCAAFGIALSLPSAAERPIVLPLFPSKVVRRNLHVYLPFIIRHGTASAVWTLWVLYLVGMGGSMAMVGVVQATNTLTQFAVMYLGVDRFDCRKLIPAGLLLSALTFASLLMAPDIYWILPTQILLGLSWGTLWAGSLSYVNRYNPERATASGMLEASKNVAATLGPTLSWVMVIIWPDTFAPFFWLAVAGSLAGLLLFYLLRPDPAAERDAEAAAEAAREHPRGTAAGGGHPA